MSKSKATIEPARALPRIEVAHGIYRIIAGHLAGSGQAFAYLGGRRIHTATETSVEAAIASVSEALDARMKELRRQRDGDIPGAAEFAEALQGMEPRTFAALVPLLRAHRYSPRHAASLADIGRVTGIPESSVATLYVKLGKTVGATLGVAPVGASISRRLLPLLVFAIAEAGAKDSLSFRFQPSFVAALDGILGVHRRSTA
ncbi:MAG: hypothetical protein Q8M19_10090 [Reyranella sp.]|nr:hypothetical protein [Reyranella sp.]